MLPPFAEQPECEQPERCACRINHDVFKSAFPGRNEELVDFIAAGIERGAEQGESRAGPAPRAPIVATRLTQGPPDQQREHGVFRDVGAFPNEQNDGADRGIGDVREQPPEGRFDDAR